MAAGSEQEQDRTEPATPFKLKEARKRGQVSKSLETNSLLMLSAALLIMYAMGERIFSGQLRLSSQLLIQAHQVDFNIISAMGLYEFIVKALFGIFIPFIFCVMATAIAVNFFQTGPIISFFPLKPDMNRLNPVTGFKRIFSKKLLFEAFKTILKMGIFGAVIYFAIQALLPTIMAMIDIDPQAYPLLLLNQAKGLVYKLLLVLLLIALADLMYGRWDFSQQMRMSRRELKEEVKRREGDPQVRARIRQLQKEAVQRAASVQKVPEADVLITNPTRLAVALKYDRTVMASPEIIAKGANDLALKMRMMARRSRVPIVEKPSLARKLFRSGKIGAGIPEPLFPIVAKILAWIYLQRQQESQGAT